MSELDIYDLMEIKYIVKIKMLHDEIYARHTDEEDTHEPVYQKVCYAFEAKKTEMMLDDPDLWEKEKSRIAQFEQNHRELMELYSERVALVTNMMKLIRKSSENTPSEEEK